MSARRRARTAPRAAESDEPARESVRHVHGPLAALLDPPITRYSTTTPDATISAEGTEEET
ncbi:MAG: hypothetical protein ACTMH5_13355 [Brachybacterium sp.]|uniref:hypothetical protein n=1 Tax=Brachybacterium sp. TaxID=1891286 RepID=UPI003F91341D